MWKHIASNALTLMIVALIAVGAFVAWAKNQYSGPGPLAEAICVKVEGGTNIRKVSENLLERGAISNDSLFRVGARYSEKANKLKRGSYLVPSEASMEEIVDIVTRGGQSTCGTEVVYRIGIARSEIDVRRLAPATNRFEVVAEFEPGVDAVPASYSDVRADADTRYRVSMAEGVTSWQVMTALMAADFLDGQIDVIPAEGSLAPDSYELKAGDLRSDVIIAMQERQVSRLDEAWRNRADDLPVNTPSEALILASIVEKETGLPEERADVASVFVNRLNLGMRLQTDPTVIYGITNGQGILGRGLRQSELRRETPYNTYVISGLPPTPIANPGLAAIEAALNPTETKYIYFVADGTGGHAFAETLDEHNRNVAKWREIEASRDNN